MRNMRWAIAFASIVLLSLSCGSKRLTGIPNGQCEFIEIRRGSSAWFPAWNSTGRRIAVMSSQNESGDFDPGLYVVEVRSGRASRIVGRDSMGFGGAWWVQWAPNDDRLLMWVNGQIVIGNVDAGTWQLVTDGAREENRPCWSPSGDSVLFTRGWLSQSEPLTAGGLYVRNIRNGLQYRFLSRDSVVTYSLDRYAYSPDGAWIACVVGAPNAEGLPNAAHEIEIVRSDGSERRRLTNLQGEARNPQWVSNDELEFDYVPYECTGTGSTPVVHTLGVRIDGTLLDRWREDLVDSRVQFSWLPAIDRRLERAAVIWLDPKTDKGELFVRPLRGGRLERVFSRRP